MKLFTKFISVKISDPDLVKVKTPIITSNLNSLEIGGYLVGNKTNTFPFFPGKCRQLEIVKLIHCANTSQLDRKYKFKTKYNFYAKEIKKIYRESGGKNKIIGEWHTHPGGSFIPSKVDDDTVWKKKWLNGFFIMGIVTTDTSLILLDKDRKVKLHLYHYKFGFKKRREYLGCYDL